MKRLLARKISRAKWDEPDWRPGGIKADAVTGDLGTQGNELSLWGFGEANELDEVVLALAAARDRVDRMDLVWIERSELESLGISLKASPGDTPVESLRDTHVDAVHLDADSIMSIARLVSRMVKTSHRRLSKKEVAEILARAVRDERVSLPLLQEKVRSEVEKVRAKPAAGR